MGIFNFFKSQLQRKRLITFHFEISFDALEELLRVYKKLDLEDQPVILKVYSPKVTNLSLSFPSKNNNVLQTLKFSLEGMISTYHNNKSKVQIEWEQTS